MKCLGYSGVLLPMTWWSQGRVNGSLFNPYQPSGLVTLLRFDLLRTTKRLTTRHGLRGSVQSQLATDPTDRDRWGAGPCRASENAPRLLGNAETISPAGARRLEPRGNAKRAPIRDYKTGTKQQRKRSGLKPVGARCFFHHCSLKLFLGKTMWRI